MVKLFSLYLWCCDFNEKWIFGLCALFLHTVPKNAQDFLSVENNKGAFCYVNKITFEKPLGNLRMEAGCQGKQSWLEAWTCPLHLQEGKRSWQLNQSPIGQSPIYMGASFITQKWGSKSFQVGEPECSHMLGPKSRGIETPILRT